ncbi:tyrosine-type recombinase/integrase [Rhodocyclaceae bacterium SMB388]
MARIKLTAGRIRDLNCPPDKKQVFLWDTDAPGLAVRATAGAHAFVFQGRLKDRDLRLTIGDVRAWNLDDARTEARRLLTLLDQGIDPRQEKAERIAATETKREESRRAAAPALDAWGAYLKARADRWSPRTLLDHQRMSAEGGEPKTRGRKRGEDAEKKPGILRPLLVLPLDQITPARVRSWLKDESANRATQARIAFGNLRTFLNWCSDRPEYASITHPDACTARVARDELPKKAAKDDCLQREQLPLWFEHVRKLPNPVHAAYLQALLLTGARREELAGLKWEDVDFQWGSLTIRDKVEGERTIPLTPYVASLLALLARRNEWVFSSPTAESGRLQEPRDPHNKALTAAGLPHVTLHGLRRSFGTLAEWVECPAGISAQIMGHKPSAIAEKHYRRRPLDLLRQWHTKIEAWILEQAGIEQPNQEEAAPGLRVVAN